MSDKGKSNSVELASQSSGRANNTIDLDAPRKKYFFGHQGSTLMGAISFTGSVGFLLFGYDQGVLGVRSD